MPFGHPRFSIKTESTFWNKSHLSRARLSSPLSSPSTSKGRVLLSQCKLICTSRAHILTIPADRNGHNATRNNESTNAKLDDSQLAHNTKINPTKQKTVSQADAELRERLEQMSGEGGAAGIEYEDGKPNAMKRGVRNNMFRLI